MNSKDILNEFEKNDNRVSFFSGFIEENFKLLIIEKSQLLQRLYENEINNNHGEIIKIMNNLNSIDEDLTFISMMKTFLYLREKKE